MINASKYLEFEKASIYRDQINSLKLLQEEQKNSHFQYNRSGCNWYGKGNRRSMCSSIFY